MYETGEVTAMLDRELCAKDPTLFKDARRKAVGELLRAVVESIGDSRLGVEETLPGIYQVTHEAARSPVDITQDEQTGELVIMNSVGQPIATSEAVGPVESLAIAFDAARLEFRGPGGRCACEVVARRIFGEMFRSSSDSESDQGVPEPREEFRKGYF